jgi:hypothetical protein
MKLDNKVQVERTCKSFWKLVQPGTCNELDTDWELTVQEEYMQRHSYKYSTEDDTQGNNKGCIAMTGTAVLRAFRKKLFFLARNGGQGYFLSPSAQGVIGIVSQTFSREISRGKNLLFQSKYFRLSKSNITGKPKKKEVNVPTLVLEGDPDVRGKDDQESVVGGSKVVKSKKGTNSDKVHIHICCVLIWDCSFDA